MNRIQELIKELCPNGVEWKTLGEIGKISMCKRIMKNETSDSGDIPFYKIGSFGGIADSFISRDLFEKYKKTYSYPKKGEILLSASGTIGKSVIFDGTPSYFQDSNIVWISNDEKVVFNKYLYYYYQIAKWNISSGGTIARLYNDNLAKTPIQIPPLPVQTEIVRILDKFVEQQEQLEKLIELRKKQYEYYREEMLKTKEGEEWETKTLGECCKYSKERISYNELNTFNYISVENLLQNKEGKVNSMSVPTYGNWIKFDKGDVLIGNIRPYLRKIWHSNILGGTNGDVLVFKINNKNILSDRFLYYILSSERFFKYDIINSDGAKMPRGNKNAIMKYIFSFPSLESQSKIVKTLDSFESSISALTSALELSKKRYEHYRDEMLRF